MSKNLNRLARRHITEANRAGSMQKFVGANGEINAEDKKDLLKAFVEMAAAISSGEMYTDVSHTAHRAGAREEASENRRIVREAYADKSGASWPELGSGIAAELQTRMEREGFMRQLFTRADVAEGSIPRIRTRTPNVRAVVARGIAQNWPQFVRDRYMTTEEFTISANVRVEELDLHQGSADILEDKFFEAQEAISVNEDRVVRNLFDASVGIYNNVTYFSGAFTPTLFQGLRFNVSRWRLPVANLVFAMDILSDFLVGNDFSTWFDPISKYELVQSGNIGSILGTNLITDGFREPTLAVLQAGEVYTCSNPEFTGAYTDRGPVQSNPVDSYADGVPARGWYMYEHISAVLANAKSVSKAVKQ
jgi:hypothetical protein